MVRYIVKRRWFFNIWQEVLKMAVIISFIGYSIKVVIFAAIAYAGILCGKKFRDRNDAKKAGRK